jgi:hypothetical protein
MNFKGVQTLWKKSEKFTWAYLYARNLFSIQVSNDLV